MLLAKNKKALFEHTLLEKYVAGIVLHGYEVKALREGKVNFDSSYVQILSGVPYVINLYIGKYSKQSSDFTEYDSRRSRKLLLNKKEIEDIRREILQKGKTAVPLAFILHNNNIKIEFGIVKGKKEFEKKQVAKERQIKRDLEIEAKTLNF